MTNIHTHHYSSRVFPEHSVWLRSNFIPVFHQRIWIQEAWEWSQIWNHGKWETLPQTHTYSHTNQLFSHFSSTPNTDIRLPCAGAWVDRTGGDGSVGGGHGLWLWKLVSAFSVLYLTIHMFVWILCSSIISLDMLRQRFTCIWYLEKMLIKLNTIKIFHHMICKHKRSFYIKWPDDSHHSSAPELQNN